MKPSLHSFTRSVRRWPRLLCVGGLLVSTAGCQGRILAPTHADATRERLAATTAQLEATRARVRELESEVARLARAHAPPIDPEAAQATSALASISVSTLSAVQWTPTASREGSTAVQHATLSLVVVPRDGLGRVIQVVGTLKVSVAVLVPGQAPLAAAAATITPLPLREAYRDGFLGSHYTIEVPLEWESAAVARAASVSIEFTDALTQRALPAAATIPILLPLKREVSVGSTQ